MPFCFKVSPFCLRPYYTYREKRLLTPARRREQNFQNFFLRHAEFIKTCPSGQLRVADLIRIYAQFFPTGNAEPFAKHVFRSLDASKEMWISFKELMLGISVSLNGSIDEKLTWAFKMFDENQNGSISRKKIKKQIC